MCVKTANYIDLQQLYFLDIVTGPEMLAKCDENFLSRLPHINIYNN